MNETRRSSSALVNALLLLGAPLVFVGVAELAIAALGIETDLARNANAQIAVPVWLLADEVWVADQHARQRRGEEAIAAEDVAWLYHFEEARWIQYKLRPGIDVEAINPFNEIEVDKQVAFRLRSNDAGFRERAFGEKAPGTIRIVTLGDSSTFGWGAEEEHTFQYMLETALQEWRPDRNVEVLNLGIPGHNTRHGLGMLEHYALPLEPDILIVAYGANDPRWVPTPTDVALARDDTAVGAVRHALLRLRSYRLLRRLLLTALDPLQRPTPGAEETRQLVRAVDLDSYRDNLGRMIDRGRERGTATILMSVCTGNRDYAAAMREVAEDTGVPVLDVRDLFTERVEALIAGELYPERVDRYRRLYGPQAMGERRSLYVTSDGCHPNWVGHSLIADELLPRVKRVLGQPDIEVPNPGEHP